MHQKSGKFTMSKMAFLKKYLFPTCKDISITDAFSLVIARNKY